jgi:REP element-mobilizing transposase RayT
MPNTYTQTNIHAIFAVKGRENFLHKELLEESCKYMHGILVNLNQYPLAISGFKNHVHLFFEQNPTSALSDIIEKVKANSSKWINLNKKIVGHFEWQRGYGGFSYARSQRNKVIKYIINQEKHHQEITFRNEYLTILKNFEIEYDDRYLFEFYDQN